MGNAGSALRVAVAVAALLACGAGGAGAEELYLCDGGRLVSVTPETLEDLKRRDPCIARYFGLEVAAAPVAPAKPAAPPPLAPKKAASEPVVAENQSLKSTARTPGAPRETGALQSVEAGFAKIADAIVASRRDPKPVAADVHDRKEPAATPSQGYREVHILNAGAGESAIYHHQR